jgi:5-hydroxyisourate hydrolase
MPGKLSTHVLDTSVGHPAAGMKIELWTKQGAEWSLLKSVETNSEGRTVSPVLAGDELQSGEYELVFLVGEYYGQRPAERFLDRVPVRVNLMAGESYHIPLLCSPWSYTTYRGS